MTARLLAQLPAEDRERIIRWLVENNRPIARGGQMWVATGRRYAIEWRDRVTCDWINGKRISEE